MAKLNPNAPIRIALLQALSGIGIPGWARKVPKDVDTPNQYFLITSQTKNPTVKSKDGWEWLCTTVIDIIYSGPAGYASPIENDTIEQKVIQAIEAGLNIQGFQIKSTDFVQSINLDSETPTQSIERQVVTYQHWVQQIEYQTT